MPTRAKIQFGLLLVTLLVATRALAEAQTTSTIKGTVRAGDGSAIAGAAVTIASAGKPQSVATNAKGEFRFPGIAPGDYTVSVERPSYKPLKNQPVSLPGGGALDLHITLATISGSELPVQAGNQTVQLPGSAGTSVGSKRGAIETAPPKPKDPLPSIIKTPAGSGSAPRR